MEKGTDHVIVMTKDARFVKLNTDKQAVVGEEIYFFEEELVVERRPIGRAVLAAVMAFFLILASVPFIGPYLTPVYAIVSVDINPSLELFLDKEEEVIRYRAYNERARDVLSRDLIGDPIEEALEQILDRVETLAYKEPDTPVLIGFSSENEQFREQLSEHLTSFATEKENYRFALIAATDVPEEKVGSLGKTVLKIKENEELETLDNPGLKRIEHGLPAPAVENRERVEEKKEVHEGEKAERERERLEEKREREEERLEEKRERKEEHEHFVEQKKEAARQKAEKARGKGPEKAGTEKSPVKDDEPGREPESETRDNDEALQPGQQQQGSEDPIGQPHDPGEEEPADDDGADHDDEEDDDEEEPGDHNDEEPKQGEEADPNRSQNGR